jgi:hypothetical protein
MGMGPRWRWCLYYPMVYAYPDLFLCSITYILSYLAYLPNTSFQHSFIPVIELSRLGLAQWFFILLCFVTVERDLSTPHDATSSSHNGGQEYCCKSAGRTSNWYNLVSSQNHWSYLLAFCSDVITGV